MVKDVKACVNTILFPALWLFEPLARCSEEGVPIMAVCLVELGQPNGWICSLPGFNVVDSQKAWACPIPTNLPVGGTALSHAPIVLRTGGVLEELVVA